ncbi:hypothetical protein [Flavobacterium sp. 5]|uniref:hypothetical protein n=1 Tax=Flavobacterium sp. 5 TaxID=2035199 RepID=UPI000C2C4D0A|nr:hypothetical protein [Flavobacterium sp. 5]PKB17236.1 hypothetical protein CLU82_2421 [Flavobacterium sp. 5]
MDIFQHIIDYETKDVLASNFPDDVLNLVNIDDSGIITIEIHGKSKKIRYGSRKNALGILYIFTYEERYVASSKLFRDLLEISEHSMNTMVTFKNTFSLNQNEYVQGLLHNLTSINTYNIQDIFSLVPQQTLAENLNTQHEILKEIIVKQPRITANTLLKLIKSNYAMKIEFSVFEKTVMKNPIVQKSDYSIREIVLSILQIFIDDFEKKGITVTLDSNPKRLFLDYDIFFVSLYYIFENAVKYCLGGSTFKIFLVEEGLNDFIVVFDMISVRIEEEEVTKLTTKNYRSVNAIKLTDKGKGIGMHRVLKTLRLNNAKLEVYPRSSNSSFERDGHVYEHNRIRIILDSTRIV